MVIEKFCWLDLMDWTRLDKGEPWNDDLLSKNDDLESEEVRVVAIVAIEMN